MAALKFKDCARICQDSYEFFSKSKFKSGAISRLEIPGARTGRNFFGASYISGDTGIIAFRGSKEIEDWLGADINIANASLPIDQLGDAFDYFGKAYKYLTKKNCKRFVVTGHSLGGGLAALVAGRVSRIPVRGITFNAPGLANYKSVRTNSLLGDFLEEKVFPSHLSKKIDSMTPVQIKAVSTQLIEWTTKASKAASTEMEDFIKKLYPNEYKILKNALEEPIGLITGKQVGELNIPVTNKSSGGRIMVFNVMHQDDPVSQHGQHIGESYIFPYQTSKRGWNPLAHSIDDLIGKLEMHPYGGYQI